MESNNNYILCECGASIFKSNLAGHKKRSLHIKKMEEKTIVKEEKICKTRKELLRDELINILLKFGELIKEEN